jgi:type IV secretory pathway protease TraF
MKNPVWLYSITPALFVLFLVLVSPYWVYNLSPSVPRGIYVLTNTVPRNGNYCLVSRYDLPVSFSFLPSYLIKVLVFSGSEHLLINDQGVFVDDLFICSRPVKPGLPRFFYSARIPAGYGVLINPHKDSFDSRFFGPVSLAVLKPLELVIKF